MEYSAECVHMHITRPPLDRLLAQLVKAGMPQSQEFLLQVLQIVKITQQWQIGWSVLSIGLAEVLTDGRLIMLLVYNAQLICGQRGKDVNARMVIKDWGCI
jgi:hypothetical protein